jgi:predicted small lipoprotein YifL
VTNRKSNARWLPLVILTFALGACGYRGALYIPEKTEQTAPETPDKPVTEEQLPQIEQN